MEASEPTDVPVPAPLKHALGWKRPLPGRGALELLPHADTSGIVILDEVDPRGIMPPALDQGQLGSCTANATNRAFRFDALLDGHDCGELSRLWTYYFERALEHTLGQGDIGAYGHDAFTVARHGIPDETRWPYDIGQYAAKPPALWPRDYTLRKPVHAVPQDLAEVKAVLSNHQTIAYGFTVYRSFEETWPVAGEMPEPDPSEEVLGGHENLLCGYLKDYPDHLLSLNSWGSEWGAWGGYFLIPAKFVLDPNMASDFRTIVRAI